jgi:hypothetical protein
MMWVAGPIGDLTLPPPKRKITISGPNFFLPLLYLIFYLVFSVILYIKNATSIFFSIKIGEFSVGCYTLMTPTTTLITWVDGFYDASISKNTRFTLFRSLVPLVAIMIVLVQVSDKFTADST